MVRYFTKYFSNYKKELFFSIACVTIECILELFIPFIMADIIDVGIANKDINYVIRQSGIMVLFALLALVFGMIYARTAARAGQGFAADLRKAEYTKVQAFSFANLDHFSTPSLVTRLTSDVTIIQNAFANGLRPIIRGPAMMIAGVILACFINTKLAIVFLIALPVLGCFLFFILTRLKPIYSKMQKAVDKINRVVQENLAGIRIVKAYVRGNYECEKFEDINTEVEQITYKGFHYAVMNAPAFNLVMYSTIIAILWFGGGMIQVGSMKVGELTGFLSYVLQILNALMMISGVFLMLTRSMTSMSRIKEVMDERIDIIEPENPVTKIENGNVTFENVSFKYSKEAKEDVLKNINLNIKSGEVVGIIGGTGSGKTSLVQLIPRLYDVSEGCVKVGDKDVRKYDTKDLRDEISMVLQSNMLFSGTIMANLRWGNPKASQNDVDWACSVACAKEFIDEMPEGYNTQLGQSGVNVSGGQKQRLCIARALLKNPKILIFDDSTSAVDTVTEEKIRKRLLTDLKQATKIIISQRITSVMDADQIIVLKNGEIDEIGTHQSLLQSNNIYQQMYKDQQKGAMI